MLRHRVQSMIQRLQQEDVNLHGFLLTVRGTIKAGAYYRPFREGQTHRMYSVSKTMTGLAVGMLADEGKLDLDQPVSVFFPDLLPEHPDSRILRQTVRDMLRMATCYKQTEYRERVDRDWSRPCFTGTPTHEPGTVFNYDTGASQVLASLVRRLSGMDVMDFLEQRLFRPLNLQDERFWLKDPSGCSQGGSGLCMSLRDLNRVALCLANGGESLVPAWFVREMTRRQIGTFQRTADEERFGYGWQCWQNRNGWSMYGMGGQMVIACPAQQALLTTIADTRLDPCGVQKIYNAFFEEIVPYTANEDMAPELFSPTVQTLPDRPESRVASAGPFAFPERNPLQLRSLVLQGNRLILERADTVAVLPFLPGEYLETSWPDNPDVPAIVTSGWTDPGQLRLHCHAVGTAPCGFEMLLCLREDTVTVQCFRSSDPLTDNYDGVASGRLVRI